MPQGRCRAICLLFGSFVFVVGTRHGASVGYILFLIVSVFVGTHRNASVLYCFCLVYLRTQCIASLQGYYLFFCPFVKKYLFLYIAVQLRRFIFLVGKKFFLSRGDISTQLGKFYIPVFGAMPFCKVCLFRFLRTHHAASLLLSFCEANFVTLRSYLRGATKLTL